MIRERRHQYPPIYQLIQPNFSQPDVCKMPSETLEASNQSHPYQQQPPTEILKIPLRNFRPMHQVPAGLNQQTQLCQEQPLMENLRMPPPPIRPMHQVPAGLNQQTQLCQEQPLMENLKMPPPPIRPMHQVPAGFNQQTQLCQEQPSMEHLKMPPPPIRPMPHHMPAGFDQKTPQMPFHLVRNGFSRGYPQPVQMNQPNMPHLDTSPVFPFHHHTQNSYQQCHQEEQASQFNEQHLHAPPMSFHHQVPSGFNQEHQQHPLMVQQNMPHPQAQPMFHSAPPGFGQALPPQPQLGPFNVPPPQVDIMFHQPPPGFNPIFFVLPRMSPFHMPPNLGLRMPHHVPNGFDNTYQQPLPMNHMSVSSENVPLMAPLGSVQMVHQYSPINCSADCQQEAFTQDQSQHLIANDRPSQTNQNDQKWQPNVDAVPFQPCRTVERNEVQDTMMAMENDSDVVAPQENAEVEQVADPNAPNSTSCGECSSSHLNAQQPENKQKIQKVNKKQKLEAVRKAKRTKKAHFKKLLNSFTNGEQRTAPKSWILENMESYLTPPDDAHLQSLVENFLQHKRNYWTSEKSDVAEEKSVAYTVLWEKRRTPFVKRTIFVLIKMMEDNRGCEDYLENELIQGLFHSHVGSVSDEATTASA